jgi:hypothetical protein
MNERDREVIVLPPKLRDSQWFDFWSNLEIGQEVRHVDRPRATYWVHDTVLQLPPPGVSARFGTVGLKRYLPLRNKNGGVNLVYIGKIRPLEEG